MIKYTWKHKWHLDHKYCKPKSNTNLFSTSRRFCIHVWKSVSIFVGFITYSSSEGLTPQIRIYATISANSYLHYRLYPSKRSSQNCQNINLCCAWRKLPMRTRPILLVQKIKLLFSLLQGIDNFPFGSLKQIKHELFKSEVFEFPDIIARNTGRMAKYIKIKRSSWDFGILHVTDAS